MSRTLPATLAALLLAALAPAAAAAPSACPAHHAGGAAPDLLNERLAPKTRELCYREFAVLHSGLTRTPLYAAEHLTAAQLHDARGDERNDTFHEEARLPRGERATLADYRRSGYDRGHLAPSADMPDPGSQHESFSLANIVPQAPENNRGVWLGVERAVRDMAMASGELYVVTGPAFKGANLQSLRGRVLVPTHVWKAVYDPRAGRAAAYVAANVARAGWEEVSIAELRAFTGIDPFPALPEEVKERSFDLPDPVRPGYGNRSGASQPHAGSGRETVDAAVAVLRMLARR